MTDSKRWLARHHSDPYVKKARQEGYRSRAAYKLLELQQKYSFLAAGMTVLDLGAAPGGWSQVARQIVGHRGCVIAVDLLPMSPIAGVEFLLGDFTEDAVLAQLMNRLNNDQVSRAVNVVLSDMSPNLSGQKLVDQPRGIRLVESALDCALQVLEPGGVFVTKIFQGSGVDEVIKRLKQSFKMFKIYKPDASRSASSEIYAVARGRR